jgi:hypothetical protein
VMVSLSLEASQTDRQVSIFDCRSHLWSDPASFLPRGSLSVFPGLSRLRKRSLGTSQSVPSGHSNLRITSRFHSHPHGLGCYCNTNFSELWNVPWALKLRICLNTSCDAEDVRSF